MDLIGKTTINPIFFYSGKISGYLSWTVLIFAFLDINLLRTSSFVHHENISVLFLILGLIFAVISFYNLGSSTRLGLPTESTVFKKNGLYRISRNPMYLGFNLLTIAAMLYTLNLLIILMGIYSIIVYHLIIIGEERFLEDRFGFEYANYKKNTRRYL